MRFNRRAQIGAGLTWVVAFVIIFFVMILFMSATIALAGTKKMPLASWMLGAGKQEMSTGGENAVIISTNAQRSLITGLENKVVVDGVKISAAEVLVRLAGAKDEGERKRLGEFVYPAFNSACKDYLIAMDNIWIYSADGKNGFGNTQELHDVMGKRKLTEFDGTLLNVTSGANEIRVGYFELLSKKEGCK